MREDDPCCPASTGTIKFDGASLITDLYVNGTFAGEHRGGFAGFVWDVTPYLAVGQDNVLAVKVNNAVHPDILVPGPLVERPGAVHHLPTPRRPADGNRDSQGLLEPGCSATGG
jgi:Glycosyl hydrolases family 2, sugar binding domain